MQAYSWIFGALLYSSTVAGIPTVVPDPIPCVKELELHFFPEHLVSQALSLYNVRQELWLPIYQSLKSRTFEVPERMNMRTSYMVPNPIEYPMQRGPTAKILK